MPRVDFPSIEEATGSLLPDGKYPVIVHEVESKTTRNGDEMWSLTLHVVAGEYEGWNIWDNITFSAKGLSRVKLVCSRLGIDVSAAMDLEPRMLIGKCAVVTVLQEDYPKNDGSTGRKSKIPFDGWEIAKADDLEDPFA